MKKISIFIVSLLLSLQSLAYNQYKLFDLALSADKVVYGTITKVDETQFQLSFTEKGRNTTLKIPKSVNQTGAVRWLPYATGQRVLVFLKKVGRGYVLMSSGPESEIPIYRDSLVVDMNYFMPGTVNSLSAKGVTPAYKRSQTFQVGNETVFGLKFSARYLYQNIQIFRNCYQLILKNPNSIASFNCFNFFDRYIRDKLNAEKKKSKLFRLLFNDMERAQAENCKAQNESTGNVPLYRVKGSNLVMP